MNFCSRKAVKAVSELEKADKIINIKIVIIINNSGDIALVIIIKKSH